MAEKTTNQGGKAIVVTGDLAIDWFEISTPPQESQHGDGLLKYNWQAYAGFHRFARPGGALMMAEFFRHAVDAVLVTPQIEIENALSGQVVQAFAALDSYPVSTHETGKRVYRLKEWKGLIGKEKFEQQAVKGKIKDAAMIIYDDVGNGFRNNRSAWEDILINNHAWIIHKMSRPLGEGELWNEVVNKDNPLVLIVEADDLRMMDVKISRCLSWERTAQDLAWQMAYNRNIQFMHEADYLVVRFGADGAVLYNNRDEGQGPRLFFDPKVGEEDFGSICPGEMVGIGNAFTVGFAAELLKNNQTENIGEAVCRGISCMKKLWQSGFGDNVNNLDYQYDYVFNSSGKDKFLIAEAEIPLPSPVPDQVYWCILEELPAFVEMIAINSVLTGKDDSLERVPLGQYGNLITLDRSEIESFNSVKNLVKEYLNSPSVKRPLSIGVFGPPGSGKSFGVTEVIKSIDPDKVPKEPLEFNLSQFRKPEELITSFHKVRDVALQGIIPLVFFDEFDSEYNGEKLGWLKFFLAPMQDGLFRDGEVLHPVGRAIFVFAGGTRSTFEEFSKQETSQAFKDAKGSDFVSRLRGFINIKGPNPVGGDMRKDRLAMIRRATVLRFLLKKHAPDIFKAGKMCQIDRGVLQAFIKISNYKHGIRSMQSIIEMSSLAGRKKYEQAALPSPDQLRLHVDADAFHKIVVREVIFSAARESIAETIHEKYRQSFREKKTADDPSLLPWGKLADDLIISNLGQADHILEKLSAVNCDFIPVTDRKIEEFSFSPEELEFMAELEHERFAEEKIRQGWVKGEKRDNKRKTRPDLVPWGELPDDIKEYDRNTVQMIPELLAKAGLEIYRLE